MLHLKRKAPLPVAGDPDTVKQTNEIKIAIPLLESLDLKNKNISADALLTRRSFATWLRARHAHYHFTVKGNRPALCADLEPSFTARPAAAHFCNTSCGHGRIETRSIWVTDALNGYLEFAHLHQAFLIERQVIEKKAGKIACELATASPAVRALSASPPPLQRLLEINRGHWRIESRCHYIIDWTFDEGRGRIRAAHGSENITRLHRFAVALVLSKAGRPGRQNHAPPQPQRAHLL